MDRPEEVGLVQQRVEGVRNGRALLLHELVGTLVDARPHRGEGSGRDAVFHDGGPQGELEPVETLGAHTDVGLDVLSVAASCRAICTMRWSSGDRCFI